MNASRLSSRYPERDDPRSPSIKPTVRASTGGTSRPSGSPRHEPGNQRGGDADNRADQDAGPWAALRAAPKADARADGDPAANAHRDVGVYPGNRVTEGYDDEGDGEANPDRQPDQTAQHSVLLTRAICAFRRTRVRRGAGLSETLEETSGTCPFGFLK